MTCSAPRTMTTTPDAPARLGVATVLLLWVLCAAVPAAARAEAAWDARTYDYARPGRMLVEETTPTPQQVAWMGWPGKDANAARLDGSSSGPAEPRVVYDMNVVRLRFRDASGEAVTSLMATPRDVAGPFPLVVAIHGLHGHKAQLLAQVGPPLVKRGFAVLAMDLPLHGERPGSTRDLWRTRDFAGAMRRHRQAIIDVRQCIDLAEQRADLNVSAGVTLVGYSLGSWISSVAGPADPRVRAMVLLVGGAFEVDDDTRQRLPGADSGDPLRALPHFAGRPVLMLNARFDRIVTPEMGERLFRAAAEPKQQRWYDASHLLPLSAYDDAAQWIADTAAAPTP